MEVLSEIAIRQVQSAAFLILIMSAGWWDITTTIQQYHQLLFNRRGQRSGSPECAGGLIGMITLSSSVSASFGMSILPANQ